MHRVDGSILSDDSFLWESEAFFSENIYIVLLPDLEEKYNHTEKYKATHAEHFQTDKTPLKL